MTHPWHEQRDILQMARQIRRHGCVFDGAYEGTRGGEPEAKEDVCRVQNGR